MARLTRRWGRLPILAAEAEPSAVSARDVVSSPPWHQVLGPLQLADQPGRGQGAALPTASDVGAPGPTGQPSSSQAMNSKDHPAMKVSEYGSISETSVPMPALAT